MTGSYELTGERVKFGQTAATQMACLNPTDTERPFRETLTGATRLSIVRGGAWRSDAQLDGRAIDLQTEPASLAKLRAALLSGFVANLAEDALGREYNSPIP